MQYDEIDRFVQQVEQAIITSTSRLSDLNLRVKEVELSAKIAFEKKVEGGLDIKIVRIGTGISSSTENTVTVVFRPKTVVTAAAVEDEFIDAIEVVQRAIAELDNRFNFVSANVELGFNMTVDGKLSVVVGGEGSHAVTHTAKLYLENID